MKRIISFLNAYTQGISGGDLRFIEVVKRLREYNFTIITSALGKKTCETRGVITQYIILSKEKQFKNVLFIYLFRTLKAIFLNIDTRQIDIIYSTSDFLPDIIPAFVYKTLNKNIKWIAFLHLIAPNPFYGFEGQYLTQRKIKIPRIKDFLFKLTQLIAIILMKYRADIVCVVNVDIKKYLEKKGISPYKIKIVNNGVDFYKINEVKKPEGYRYDAIFVGRFHPQKGIFDLINIWAGVCKYNVEAKLALVGDGPKFYINKVKSLINEKNMSNNIELLGFLNGQSKYEIMKSSKIFVFPSTYESWGIAVAEAMACGLPVIAYDLPIYEGIFNLYIKKVPIGACEKFSKEILHLLEQPLLRMELSRKAMEFIKKYDWDNVAYQEKQLINTLF